MFLHSDKLEKNSRSSVAGIALLALICAPGCKKGEDKANASEPASQTESAAKSVEDGEGTAKGVKDTEKRKTREHAVIPEIAEGIKKHIAGKSEADGGHFALSFEDRELKLKLVRVHIEYLASLGANENFACVDLVDTDGEVYDVDFFMSGPPGNMKVTETTVHKINGVPLYAWEQQQDKTWKRVPMDEASAKLQGVIEPKDSFEFVYEVTLPTMEESARLWVPIPTTDEFQTVETLSMETVGTETMINDSANANKIMVLDLLPEHSGKKIELRYFVDRIEKSSYAEELSEEERKRFLAPDRLIPINEELLGLAKEATKGKTESDLIRGRAIYDHVMERMKYQKVGNKYGNGDAVYACDSRNGNCSDYHSYFIALARAIGIPSRFAVGAAIPSTRDQGVINGYHCWAEFYADGKWWPIDVSEGDKYTNLSTYYFGHHPANRIEMSRGRDLSVDPAPASGPINFLVHPLFEVGGKKETLKADFSFIRGREG